MKAADYARRELRLKYKQEHRVIYLLNGGGAKVSEDETLKEQKNRCSRAFSKADTALVQSYYSEYKEYYLQAVEQGYHRSYHSEKKAKDELKEQLYG